VSNPERLFQVGVLGFRLFQDGDVGIQLTPRAGNMMIRLGVLELKASYLRLRSCKLHEIVRTNDPENCTHERRESSAGGVMHDGRCRKPIPHAASLKLACPSGYYIPHPFAILSVSECKEESLRRSKNIYWRPADSARLSTYVYQNAEAGQSGANRLVIRFVTARLKAATQRLRNRTRRRDASRIARHENNAMIAIVALILTMIVLDESATIIRALF
jgi:hypothetical protein